MWGQGCAPAAGVVGAGVARGAHGGASLRAHLDQLASCIDQSVILYKLVSVRYQFFLSVSCVTLCIFGWLPYHVAFFDSSFEMAGEGGGAGRSAACARVGLCAACEGQGARTHADRGRGSQGHGEQTQRRSGERTEGKKGGEGAGGEGRKGGKGWERSFARRRWISCWLTGSILAGAVLSFCVCSEWGGRWRSPIVRQR